MHNRQRDGEGARGGDGGGKGGGGGEAVQPAGRGPHFVGVCEDGEEAGGSTPAKLMVWAGRSLHSLIGRAGVA